MRTLRQPGPVFPDRLKTAVGHGQQLDYALEPGLTLNEALMRPVVASGLRSGTAVFSGAVLAPFRYVMPGPPRDDDHVAWFSEARVAPGSRVEIANATLGWRDGAPFVHCHAVWIEPDGSRRGGHILPDETAVQAGTAVRAWAVADVTIAAEQDAETNFRLFQPVAEEEVSGSRFILARVRPNQDIGAALEDICRRHGITHAHVRGSVGSLICPRFADGRVLPDYATEVLVRRAEVSVATGTEIDMIVVDMQGMAHEGRLQPGGNVVCITFEVMLEPA